MLVGTDGRATDASADIVSPAGYTPPAGRLNICGGECALNLDLVSDLEVVASEATLTGRVEARPRQSATISLEGGTWSACLIFEAGSDVSLGNLSLSGGYANVRSGRLAHMDLAGDVLTVDASESDVSLTDVTVSAQVEGNVLRLESGSATIEGLTMADTPSSTARCPGSRGTTWPGSTATAPR